MYLYLPAPTVPLLSVPTEIVHSLYLLYKLQLYLFAFLNCTNCNLKRGLLISSMKEKNHCPSMSTLRTKQPKKNSSTKPQGESKASATHNRFSPDPDPNLIFSIRFTKPLYW